MRNLITKVTIKVSPKSRHTNPFCDFVVTNILVIKMIISTYGVTLKYKWTSVLLSQYIRHTATPVPKGLNVNNPGCKSAFNWCLGRAQSE
jgi:hypothetical protein